MATWAQRRQITIVLVIGLIFFFLLAAVYYVFFRPSQSCFDGLENQDERGVDCGGVCQKVCPVEVADLINFWTRVFRVSPGQYDVGALIENPNIGFSIERLPYTIRVYDANNIPLAERRGTTFVNQKERFLIFESRIPTGNKIPVRAVLEIEDFSWTRSSASSKSDILNVNVQNKEMVLDPSPRLTADLLNGSAKDLQDIAVSAVVFDKDENVLGVSGTVVDQLPHGERTEVVFTWPEAFSGVPLTLEVYPRLDAVSP